MEKNIKEVSALYKYKKFRKRYQLYFELATVLVA